jgi:hypothetical protein
MICFHMITDYHTSAISIPLLFRHCFAISPPRFRAATPLQLFSSLSATLFRRHAVFAIITAEFSSFAADISVAFIRRCRQLISPMPHYCRHADIAIDAIERLSPLLFTPPLPMPPLPPQRLFSPSQVFFAAAIIYFRLFLD